MRLTRENTIRVHRGEITPGQAFAEQAAEAAPHPRPCTPLTRKQAASQYAAARRWTEAHGPQSLRKQLSDLLQTSRKPMSPCRLASLRRAFITAAKAAGFAPPQTLGNALSLSKGSPPGPASPCSLELRRQCPRATHAYLIGKGPSLDQLTPAAFAAHPAAPVLCCNESIHTVEALDLPNPVFCIQQDAVLKERCRPRAATWFLSKQAWEAGRGDWHPRAVRYDPKTLGLKAKSLTARIALAILANAGGFEHVHFRAFDACVTGDCGYADSIGESPTKRRKNARRFIGFCKELELAATSHQLAQHWPTSLPPSPLDVGSSTLDVRRSSPPSPPPPPPWTVASVLRSGGGFTPGHVRWLQAQCQARIKREFRFVCLTDLPEIPGVETIPLRHDWPGWWAKFELFRPDLFPGPVAYFDLDMVILRDLQLPDSDTLPTKGIAVHREIGHPDRIGSALMLFRPAAAEFLYVDFIMAPDTWRKEHHGDQDAIHAILCGNAAEEATPPWSWASYKWHIKQHGPEDIDIAAFHGSPRPWDVSAPWIPPFPTPTPAMPSRHGEGLQSPFTPSLLTALAGAGLRMDTVNLSGYRARLAAEQAKPHQARPLPPVGDVTLCEFGNGHLGDTIATSRLPQLLAERGYSVHVVDSRSTRAVFTGNPHVVGFGVRGPAIRPWLDQAALGHVSQRFARALGLPEDEFPRGDLYLSDEEIAWAQAERHAWPADKPVVIVSTGAISSQAAYLGMDWQAMIDALGAECTVVAPIITDRAAHVGTKNSTWQNPAIPDFRPERCVVYENLPTRQFMALFSIASGGFGTMGGASHIAAALGVQYIVVLPSEKPTDFSLEFPLLGESGACDARWLHPQQVFASQTAQPGGFPLAQAGVRRQIIHPDDREKVESGQLSHIVSKYLLGRKYQPSRIVEIGVRYGYSAAAWLLACPTAAYLGFDIVCSGRGTHGGVGGGANTFAYVREMLARVIPGARVKLIHANSQQMHDFPPADFYHIDGDHTAKGCLADLGKALLACEPGGVIVVDDYDHLDPVRSACDQFAAQHATSIARAGRFPSWRGEFVIEKAVRPNDRV